MDATLMALAGTPNKSKLGANAILRVSLAVEHAAADSASLPLYQYLSKGAAELMPLPLFNILNGGRHAEGSVEFQAFMVPPVGPGSFAEALRMGPAVYHSLGRNLPDVGLPTTDVDERVLAPPPSRKQTYVALKLRAHQASAFRLAAATPIAPHPADS